MGCVGVSGLGRHVGMAILQAAKFSFLSLSSWMGDRILVFGAFLVSRERALGVGVMVPLACAGISSLVWSPAEAWGGRWVAVKPGSGGALVEGISEAGGDVDDPGAQGGAAGVAAGAAGEGAGGWEQVVGDARADRPGAAGAEPAGGQVGQGPSPGIPTLCATSTFRPTHNGHQWWTYFSQERDSTSCGASPLSIASRL